MSISLGGVEPANFTSSEPPLTRQEKCDISYYANLLTQNKFLEILEICKKNNQDLFDAEADYFELDFEKLSDNTLRLVKQHVLKCLNREDFSPPPNDEDSDMSIMESPIENELESDDICSSEKSIDINVALAAMKVTATNGAPMNSEDIFQSLEYCDLAKSAIQHNDLGVAVNILEKTVKLLKEGIRE